MHLRSLFFVFGAAALLFAEKPPSDLNHPPSAPSRLDASEKLTSEISATLPGTSSEVAKPKNLVDEYVFRAAGKAGVKLAPLCSDIDYLRRVSLDLTGRLPEPDKIRKFVADPDPAKREKLIDTILYTTTKGVIRRPSTPFLDRWAYFFADLYRINGLQGRGQFLLYNHIYDSLVVNQPYDELVRELITATARSNHYNAPVNFLIRFYIDEPDQSTNNPEDTYDEFAIRTSKIFLGVNLECVSCHDGRNHLEKINSWLTARKRTEVWRQAAFFSKTKVFRPYGDLWDEFVVNNEGKGYDYKHRSVVRPARYSTDLTPTFILTGEHPQPGEDPRSAYARMVTTNIQFSRNIVNLVWAELFGAGIVEPPQDFDLDHYNSELLDALAKDFQDHHYDLRYLIGLLAKSSTYQVSHRYPGEWKPEWSSLFARRLIRRLPAPMVWDAISQASGVFEDLRRGDSSDKVKYVMQTVSADAFSPQLRQALASFGYDDRTFNSKNLSSSILQSTLLMNNDLVKAKVKADAKGRLQSLLRAEPPKSNEQIVEELFLASLSRFPSPDELNYGTKLLGDQHERGAEDLLWALLNKAEFVLNY